jgi:hypothetical protein
VRFEPTTPVFERAKAINALDHADTLIGSDRLLVSKTKLRGRSPQANYTDRATAACRRSRQPLRGQRNEFPRPLISVF